MGAALSDYFTSYADISDGYLDGELLIENFHELCAKGEFHKVSICLKKGLDPNGVNFDEEKDVYERDDTPLICAARGYHWKKGTKKHLKTMDILLKFGAKIDQWNLLGQTPLYIACDRNLLIIAQWLVEHGADVNQSSKVGISPLHCACRNQNVEMVKYLLEHGARGLKPTKIFSSIKSTSVLDEIKQQEEEQEEDDEVEEDDKGSDREAAKIEEEEQGNKTKKMTQSMSKRERITIVKEEVDRHIKKEQDTRKQMLEELKEKKIRKEQLYHRSRLAQEIKNRKVNRRKLREKASYQRYLAQIEQQKKEQNNRYLVATSSHHTEEETEEKIPALPIEKIKAKNEIEWIKETKQKNKRTSYINRSGSASRPFKWIPELAVRSGLRTAGGTFSTENKKDGNTIPTVASAASEIIQQCQELYLTMQYASNRRLRMVHTAPDAEMYRSSALFQESTRDDEPMIWKRPDTAPPVLSRSLY